MNIKLQNLKPGRVLTVSGQHIDVELQDKGQAIVTMTLTIGDGTHFHYPTGSGSVSLQSTQLAAGDHDAVIRITALKMKNFGRSYDSKVKVDGVTVATTKGVLADNAQEESDFKLFVVRVPNPN